MSRIEIERGAWAQTNTLGLSGVAKLINYPDVANVRHYAVAVQDAEPSSTDLDVFTNWFPIIMLDNPAWDIEFSATQTVWVLGIHDAGHAIVLEA